MYESATERWRGPGLTMARALGDTDAEACGLLPTPTVLTRSALLDAASCVRGFDSLREGMERCATLNGTVATALATAVDAEAVVLEVSRTTWRAEGYREGVVTDVPRCVDDEGQLAALRIGPTSAAVTFGSNVQFSPEDHETPIVFLRSLASPATDAIAFSSCSMSRAAQA